MRLEPEAPKGATHNGLCRVRCRLRQDEAGSENRRRIESPEESAKPVAGSCGEITESSHISYWVVMVAKAAYNSRVRRSSPIPDKNFAWCEDRMGETWR